MPRKRAAKNSPKKGSSGVGCLALIVLVVVANIFRPPSDKPRLTPTSAPIRAVVNTQRPSPTRTPLPSPTTQQASVQRVSASVAAQTTGSKSLIGDGILYTIEEVMLLDELDGEPAENGLLLVVVADFLSESSRCVHGWDFALMVSDKAYEAETHWMDDIKPLLGNIDYPGWGIGGQCMTADTPEPTFLVFDVPREGSGPSLNFFSESVYLGPWESLSIAESAASDDKASATPSLVVTTVTAPATDTPFPTSTPFESARINADSARFRECPRLDNCPIVQTLSRGSVFEIVEAVDGAMFDGSTTWYRAIVNGQDAYVHSSVVTTVVRETSSSSIRPVATSKPQSTARPTQVQVTNLNVFVSPRTWFATGSVNVRSCPATSCNAINTLSSGETVVLDASATGASVTGSTQWYRVQGGGYVHGSVVSSARPAPVVVQQQQQVPTGQQSVPAQTWNCSGNLYNCDDFATYADIMSYFTACPGDPSRLDQGGEPGVPCESRR